MINGNYVCLSETLLPWDTLPLLRYIVHFWESGWYKGWKSAQWFNREQEEGKYTHASQIIQPWVGRWKYKCRPVDCKQCGVLPFSSRLHAQYWSRNSIAIHRSWLKSMQKVRPVTCKLTSSMRCASYASCGGRSSPKHLKASQTCQWQSAVSCNKWHPLHTYIPKSIHCYAHSCAFSQTSTRASNLVLHSKLWNFPYSVSTTLQKTSTMVQCRKPLI